MWIFVFHFVTKLVWHILQIAGHSILAAILWSCARSVDLTSKAAITSFYMFIWKVSLASIPDLWRTLPLPLLKLKLLAVWCGAYCPAAQLNHPNDLSALCTPLNEIPKPLNRVDQLLTIYSPRGSAAVLRGVPAHPSGAVRRVEAMRWIGECRGRGRGNNSTGELECWSKCPFESWSMHQRAVDGWLRMAPNKIPLCFRGVLLHGTWWHPICPGWPDLIVSAKRLHNVQRPTYWK